MPDFPALFFGLIPQLWPRLSPGNRPSFLTLSACTGSLSDFWLLGSSLPACYSSPRSYRSSEYLMFGLTVRIYSCEQFIVLIKTPTGILWECAAFGSCVRTLSQWSCISAGLWGSSHFVGSSVNYSTLLLEEESGLLYVGGRGVLYALNTTNISTAVGLRVSPDGFPPRCCIRPDLGITALWLTSTAPRKVNWNLQNKSILSFYLMD